MDIAASGHTHQHRPDFGLPHQDDDLKNLAYRIKKNRKGHYVLMNISAPANAIAEFERIMRFNEDIIRYMTVKVEEFNDLSSAEDRETVEE